LNVDDIQVSTQSAKGQAGEWLLDPYNITISSSANASTTNAANTFTSSASDGVINTSTLQTALASNNVTVSTAGAGTDTGNITIMKPDILVKQQHLDFDGGRLCEWQWRDLHGHWRQRDF